MKVLAILIFGFCAELVSAQKASQKNVNDFNDVDENGDNSISQVEFEAFYRKIRGHVTETSTRAEKLFASHDMDNNGLLTVAEFVPLAFALSRQPQKLENEFFQRLDINKDGILTRAEMQDADPSLSNEIINGLFLVADTNFDNRIILHEYELAIGSSGQKAQEAQYSGLSKSLISSIDQDNDQRISEKELDNFTNHFNSNNKISTREIFHNFDADRDGFLVEAELRDAAERFARVIGVRPMPSVLAFGN